MLTDEQMELLGNRLVPLYQQLERDVIADIVRRLVSTGRLTETAELMVEALRGKGYPPMRIYKEVMRLINADGELRKEIAKNTLEAKRLVRQEISQLNREMQRVSGVVMQEAADMAFHGDLSVWRSDALPVKGAAFERLTAAMSARATDALLNLTKSTGFRTSTGAMVKAERMYAHQLNAALTKMTSGAYSYRQAIEEAVKELAKSGLRTVDFDSGVSRQLDTAVRNAVMTASSQLSGEITMMNVKETGVNHVEVTAHWGAREGAGHGNHAAWQGKIYCVEGTDGVYENLEAATGYPSDPTGLKGYNCRHDFHPFWVGISEPTEWEAEPPPVEVDGKTYTYYQATQEQRRREREIRALKREEAALKEAGFDEKAKNVKSLIRTKTAEYREFSEAVGIRAKTERLRVCEENKSIQIDSPYKKLTGKNFDDNMTVEVPRAVRRVVDSASKAVTRDFPVLDTYLYGIGYASDEEGNPATAQFSIDRDGNVGQMITLNPQMWSDLRIVNALVEKESAGGHVRAKGAQAIITHEYGHVVHNTLALRKIGYYGTGQVNAWQRQMFAVTRIQIGADVDSLLREAGLSIQSERAADNVTELIAEAFSDYYSGSRSKASRIVIDYLRKEMKK